MSNAIPLSVIDNELKMLGLTPNYHNRRRLARATQIQLHLQQSSSYLERIYKADSQRRQGKQYTVRSNAHGVHCTCPDAKKSEICKHAIQVLRWEAGIEVKNDVSGTASPYEYEDEYKDKLVLNQYPVLNFTVSIPLVDEHGVRVALVRATNVHSALAAAEADPDLGVIATGEAAEKALCPCDIPVIRLSSDHERKFPEYVWNETVTGDAIREDKGDGTPYDPDFYYGNDRLNNFPNY